MTTTSLPSSPAPVPPSAITTRLSPLGGVVLLLFLVVGLLCAGWAMLSGKIDLLPPKVSWDDIRHGAVTHRIAKELAGVPFAEQAAHLERGASWLLIGDTGSRVRQGCPGWLFLVDELKLQPNAARNAQARADKVTALREQLRQRDIELLLVLVPDKSRIAASELCGVARSAQFAQRLTHWRDSVQAQGLAVLDLTPVLQPQGRDAFLRTDTHWSEAGANAAAIAVAARIGELGIKPTPAQSFDLSVSEPEVRPGDLVHLAGLDWLPASLQPPVEQVRRSSLTVRAAATEAVEEDDLFGDSQLPNVAVIGTSFSRNSNFMPFLERAVGASVGNFALDGGAFSGAAKAYFDSSAFKQTPPKLIVWEIPERDLQAPYVDDIVLPAK
ncbi:MAG: cell division protein FtsQ [Pseudomonas sp.]|uniref:alginate O-acetyltransferase AlgX-related protein n=1 Tax=Pseudomonas sp. TaxID=306 RepID=UPI0027362E07|nr:cell division protein FtsQ [Pseudomonas sp.]MDP3847349.1 cell division protein FtsQ [Pseudomonas sp.]